MRLLHTGDWHVGKTLARRSRIDEARDALSTVVATAVEREVDGVLACGDFFEHLAPSPEAEQVVYDALIRFEEHRIPVVLLAGNHDHPQRWRAVESLLARFAVHVVPEVRRPERGGIVELAARDGSTTVQIAALAPPSTKRGSSCATSSRSTRRFSSDRASRQATIALRLGRARRRLSHPCLPRQRHRAPPSLHPRTASASLQPQSCRATLSGGETFLASLSLALALSGSLRELAGTVAGRLDAIFIDEGFGALDPETLDVVVDALEKLREKDRMIGVITHVPTLARPHPGWPRGREERKLEPDPRSLTMLNFLRKRQKAISLNVIELCGDGYCSVVGESHYQDGLRATSETCERGSSGRRTFTAVLVAEPRNPYDANAIAVFSPQGKLGYLSQEDAIEYQRVIKEVARRGYNGGTREAYLTGGERGKPSFGVVLRLADPFECLSELRGGEDADDEREEEDRTGPGFVGGRHYTEYVEQVKEFRRSGQEAKAEQLLLQLVDAVEAEARTQKWGVAPWYYEQLAISYRKRKDIASEIAILERFARQAHSPGASPPLLLERLAKARALAQRG